MLHRLGWAFAGAMAVVAILALARATVAGPLDPPGPVGSTMRTLDELVPSWGKTLSSTGGCNSQRFQCVMSGNTAVLDRETGLVWWRSPDEVPAPYDVARDNCVYGGTAGRYGWRLPTTSELWTLTDNSADSLPDGHPFQNVQGGPYWTTTLAPDDDQSVLTIGLFGGFNEELGKSRFGNDGFSLASTWCVRGGQSMADDAAPAEQPAWSRAMSSDGGCDSARFECVMNGVAVLDRETGLVWQRTPFNVEENWAAAYERCLRATVGGRTGWRLPTIAELGSLIDQSVPAPGAMLPPGHPFVGAGSGYWSSTEDVTNSGNVLAWKLTNGINLRGFVSFGKGNSVESSAWCVRGADTGQR
jgi:hypothetical protein